ncbi:microtubule-associated protein RP/EB family member 1B-like [Magnolia sinica]|uniref:microtubule-associated protein RP/EB family member 1B-like n=1 Tax=Magnolia sinica TaxID=86752 RepID=UPI002657FBFE|nr:microtubule-associated protein RP/EB family member 1B-like [Magnolia sinica]
MVDYKAFCTAVVNGGIMNENYNPVERRCKGAKKRNLKVLQKGPKSLQASDLPNHSSVDGTGIHISGPEQVKLSAVSGGANSGGQIQALTEQIQELKLSVDQLDKEREFYFAKLRDIEILCQSPELEKLPVADAIRKILYAADAKESALAEAQELLTTAMNAVIGGDGDSD